MDRLLKLAETLWNFIEVRIRTQRAYNAANRPLYTLQYVQPDVAKYGEGAFADTVRKSGITHIKFVRPETGSEAGLDQEIQFLDSAGQPRPNRSGIYGTRSAFNPLGRVVEAIPLGRSS